jgi:hypothetical protein
MYYIIGIYKKNGSYKNEIKWDRLREDGMKLAIIVVLFICIFYFMMPAIACFIASIMVK